MSASHDVPGRVNVFLFIQLKSQTKRCIFWPLLLHYLHVCEQFIKVLLNPPEVLIPLKIFKMIWFIGDNYCGCPKLF